MRVGFGRAEWAYNVSMTIDLVVVEFALGSFRASVDDGVVRGATFDLTPQPPRRDRFGVHDVLRAYFDGEVGALDSLRVGARGTPFQHEVWEQLRMIPVRSEERRVG